MRWILDFDPLAAAPRTVSTVAALSDDALQPHDARLPEHHRAIHVLKVVAQPDAVSGIGEKLLQGSTPSRP
jgi:hypothetical protein